VRHQTLLGEGSVAEAARVVAVRFQVPVHSDWWGVVRHSLTGIGLSYSDSGNPMWPEQGGVISMFYLWKIGPILPA